MERKMCALVAKRTIGVVVKCALCLPELVLRRNLAVRQNLATAVCQWDQAFDSLHAQCDGVRAQGDAVEAAEGFLYECAKCGAPSRSRHGGKPDSEAIHLIGGDDPLAVPDWLCPSCFGSVMQRAEQVAMWYGAFLGLFKLDCIPGHTIIAEKGWICSQAECDSTPELREHMHLVAARTGANACVSYRWEGHEESVLAGHSANGRPFYRTERSYSATARAVVVEPGMTHRRAGANNREL